VTLEKVRKGSSVLGDRPAITFITFEDPNKGKGGNVQFMVAQLHA